MLKKLIPICFVLIVTLLIGSIVVFALDDQGQPNDPAINERANACYEDGTMAGKCDTELEWQAGWYLIRYEFGIFQREEIPDWVEWVLPPESMPEYSSPVSSVNYGVCPSITFNCTQLFTCNEAKACLAAGNFTLDPNADGTPCNEVGNLLGGTIACK